MATVLQTSECTLVLPSGWVNPRKFEAALQQCGDALGSSFTNVVVRVSAGSKMTIDVILRVLSFCNQVVTMTKRMLLVFEGGQQDMGYLDRMGFFDHLQRAVSVSPTRPLFSRAAIHRGGNATLVEIESFSGTVPAEQSLISRLGAAAQRICVTRADVAQIQNSVSKIFSELVANVAEHSRSPLDGYAALQCYGRGNEVRIAVSDSGIGIIDSLRPALIAKAEPAASLSDVELLIEMFKRGISRLDDQDRGNGLMASAAHAIRFQADLDIRLPRQRTFLKPANNQYAHNMAYSTAGLPLLWGTHLSFALKLA
jgi:hypothetical protein